MSKTVKVSGRDDSNILSGFSYCYAASNAARAASERATTSPGVLTLWNHTTGRYYYLGAGEVSLRANGDREQTYYGRGGKIVRIVKSA